MRSKRRTDSKGESEANKHLSNIDKLLNAAFELMKQTPSIDGAAFEQLRQLRVRIRYALSDSTETSDAVPRTAPALFKDRQDKDEGPIAFVQRTYSKWLWKSITRADIRRLDEQLYNALYNLNDPSEKLDKIGLLTKKQINDIKLSTLSADRPSTTLKMAELPPDERERARLFNLSRSRKHRSKS